SLGECRIERVRLRVVRLIARPRRVFSGEYLYVTRIAVVEIGILQKPVGHHVIVFIDRIYKIGILSRILPYPVPRAGVVCACHIGTGGAYYAYLGIYLVD